MADLTTVRYGDIVVFRYPGDPKQTFLKRVIDLPGDTLTYESKELTVNGRAIREDYVVHTSAGIVDARDNHGLVVVPKEHVFVLDDNRDISVDSRYFGPVPDSLVQGRALYIYLSNHLGRIGRNFTN